MERKIKTNKNQEMLKKKTKKCEKTGLEKNKHEQKYI